MLPDNYYKSNSIGAELISMRSPADQACQLFDWGASVRLIGAPKRENRDNDEEENELRHFIERRSQALRLCWL